MTPTQHPLCNDVLRRPEGMAEEECGDLHIFRDEGAVWSFWKPNDEQLVALNRGGAVALCVMGTTHPPLSVLATHPTEGGAGRTVDASEYRQRMDALNTRLTAFVDLTKQIAAAWTSETKGGPEHVSLVNEFLDMLNANKTDGSIVKTPKP